jgi:predicted nucleotidyltransferase
VKKVSPQSQGGKARAKALGARRREDIARKAAAARWSERPRKGTVAIAQIRRLAVEIARSASRRTSITLFGSYARGTASPSSDIDLMVVEDGLRDWAAESVRVRRLIRRSPSLLRKPIAIDLVVMSRADYRKWRGHFGTVQHEAEREGAGRQGVK